jgi:DNA mismatch repair protein MutS
MSEGGTAIFKLYKKFHDQTVKKHGEKSVVFAQIGDFYEMYAVSLDDVKMGPDLYLISDILNVCVTRKDKKKPHSISNFMMIGFPKHSVAKFKKILLDEGFTIVIVDQVSPPPGPRREIVETCSPGTVMSNEYDRDSDNYLASLYIDCDQVNDKTMYSCGLTLINVQTGRNVVSSISPQIADDNSWVNELNRILYTYSVVEYLIHYSPSVQLSDKDIQSRFDTMMNKCCNFNIYKSEIKAFSKISYQNDTLNKVFKMKTILTPIEYFDWERKPNIVLSYLFMLHHVYLHKSDLINNISIPKEESDSEFLKITSDGIRQLNIISNTNNYKGKGDSLISILNKCKTSIGKRFFKERLLSPSMDIELLEKSYENIDLYLQNDFYETIRDSLGKVSDIEKSLRNMGLDSLYDTNNLFSDFVSYEYIIKTMDTVTAHGRIDVANYVEIIDDFKKYVDYIQNTFEFDNFSSMSSTNSIEKSIFKKGIHPEIDALDDEISDRMDKIHMICEKFSSLIDTKNGPKAVKYDFSEKLDHYIYCTKKRGLTIEEKFNNMSNKSIYVRDSNNTVLFEFNKNDIKLKPHNSNNSIIDLNVIKKISTELLTLNKQIKNMNNILWGRTIKSIYEKYQPLLKNVVEFIGHVDFYSCGAYLSITNNYHRPKTDSTAEKAFIEATDIRHPIIEIISDKEFIRNDIVLGKGGQDGILLYGVNAGGKSTLMKAIGLNIIMAQAGLYTAAGTFCFKPYDKIFTRIISNDNIFKAQSSFVVECLDIHSFLNGSTKNSLVLGDEVCSTTEVIAALSLVSSSLKILCDKQSTFMFTSHLSELVNIDRVKELDNLKVYHMSVSFENEKIIFDRKLTPGVGPNHYGIKIAESLGLDKNFISIANQIQQQLNGDSNHIVNQKKSVYNSNVLMEKCEMPDCNKNACETHHIYEQADCDSKGNTGSFHKNKAHNLVPLCKECHAKITYGNLHISGWKETSDGLELQYEYIENKQENSKKKFGLKDQSIIKKYYTKYNAVLSNRKIINKLESDKGLKVSPKIFSQIVNDEY